MNALLLALAATAAAQSVELRVSTSAAALAQPVEIVAASQLPPGAKLALDLERSATDYFSFAKVEDLGGDRTQGLEITVLPLALGKVAIPLYWTVEEGGKKTSVEKASTVELEVTGPKLPEPDPAPMDIKEPRAARPALWPWLLAALLGAAAWEAYRRYKRRAASGTATQEPLPDDRPAEVIALSELDTLQPLWPEGRFKEFYFRMTEVLRHYFERRYGMPATHLTTAELYKQMREAELDRPLAVLFKDLFDRADLVKFAKIAPEADWGAKDLEGARTLVKQTTPKDLAAEAPK